MISIFHTIQFISVFIFALGVPIFAQGSVEAAQRIPPQSSSEKSEIGIEESSAIGARINSFFTENREHNICHLIEIIPPVAPISQSTSEIKPGETANNPEKRMRDNIIRHLYIHAITFLFCMALGYCSFLPNNMVSRDGA